MMKKSSMIKLYMALCLIFGIAIMPINQIEVQAAEVIATVYGSVMPGTSGDLLKLATDAGNMEIKIDSNTDTSGCKLLLQDKKIYVSVAHGNDGYLHATKITTDTPATSATVDSSSTYTVSGTIDPKTKDNMLYLKTAQGVMEIKMDANTSLKDCSVLVMGKTYTVSCARGSDAYLHAVSIADASAVSTASNGFSNGAYMMVEGTVSDKTKETLLYLSTKDGEMQFIIDNNADTSKGMVHTPGRKLAVAFYRGTDAYLHAVSIVGEKNSSSGVNVNTSSTVNVSGTVGGESNENLLYLNTPQGKMELKLDVVSTLNNCKILVSGKKITVACANGSDAYLHAVSITGN